MLTLMNYWNAVWRSNLAEIENAAFRHSDAEEQAFERQLRRRSPLRWRQPRILRYSPPRAPANH